MTDEVTSGALRRVQALEREVVALQELLRDARPVLWIVADDSAAAFDWEDRVAARLRGDGDWSSDLPSTE